MSREGRNVREALAIRSLWGPVLGLIAVGCGEAPPVTVQVQGDCAVLYLGDDVDVEGPPVFDSVDGAPWCVGNNDGSLSADEMPAVVGAHVTYNVNPPGTLVPVDSKGADQEGGHVWDFRSAPDNVAVGVTVVDPSQHWFAPHFPGAAYASPVSLWSPDVLGVFRSEPGRILMLGLASVKPQSEPAHTLLVYDEPLVVYQFPLVLGANWQQTVTFSNAVLQGVKNAGKETYKFVVDGRGTVLLPQFRLENSLRVRLELTQTFVVSQGKPDVHHVQLFFVHECLGEVARIVSPPDPPGIEFSQASEFRRLGW
ncbi:MAG: hypothetical protein FJ109_09745 [Deltaproteobacteria bacterium]|nr:hypothetical protein [Deltaproteobacteria bacterium]